jgi:HTH-type transcriptional regulator / antitoxin HigA
MDVSFADESLDRLETDPTYSGGFGDGIVKAYRKRMQQIRAATDERTFYAHRALHFEKLQGQREGQHSMRLNDQWSLIIELRGDAPGKIVRVSKSPTTTEGERVQMANRVPAEVFPPGEFIREELEARGWTQGDLAQIMGRPLRLVNELVAGKKQITPETARGLAKAFGDDDPLYWMNLDSAYRLAHTEPVDEAVARRAKLYSLFPVRELMKRNWIEPSDNLDVVEHRVCRFFEIETLNERPRLAHAAKAAQYDERTSLQYAWLYRAKELAEGVHSSAYSEPKLRAALQKLKELLVAPEEIRQVPRILAEAGVRFVIVEFLPGAKIDGAVFWLDESPVIALSLRFDRVNNFWFVLRHEIEHVLNRDGQVIDVEITESLQRKDDLPPEEVRANAAASDFVVPSEELNNFIMRVRPLYSEQRILLFAKRIGVHPGLVVGQLQFRDEVPCTHFHKHLVKIREIVTQTALTDGWGNAPALHGRNGA